MTDLVSLPFGAMTRIDCKITNFSLYLFIYSFCNNYNIGELTSAASKERMTTNIIFASAMHTHELTKSSYASKPCISVYMVSPLHSAIDRRKHEKYLAWKYGNLLVKARAPGSISHSKKAKGQLCFVFSVV